MSQKAEKVSLIILALTLLASNIFFIVWLLDMMGSDLVVNIVVSIITGLITGVIVTNYYSKRDNLNRHLSEFRNDKQNLSRYIDIVCYEIDALMKNDSRETGALKRLLVDPPRFLSFDPDRLDEKYHSVTKDIYNELSELALYLEYEEPQEKYEIYKIRYFNVVTRLRGNQIKLLEMQMKFSR